MPISVGSIEEPSARKGKAMPKQVKILPRGEKEKEQYTSEALSQETITTHFRDIQVSELREALDRWWDIYNELKLSDDFEEMVSFRITKGLQPKCGWPEFVERMWQLKSHLDRAIGLEKQ